MARILVGTLFSNVKNYAIMDWYKNLCKFSYPNFDVCAVDNSKDKKYHNKIFKYFSDHKSKSNIGKLTVLHTPRVHKDAEVFMAFSANELRKHFLKNDYDYLLYLECDIMPPVDILERLLSYGKQIISPLYFIGDKSSSYPMCSDINFYLNQSPLIINKSYIQGFYDIGEYNQPQPLTNSGLGCLLVYKDIIKEVPFRYDNELSTDNKLIHHHDVMFAKDLFKKGIQNSYVPIICRHENVSWDIQRRMIN